MDGRTSGNERRMFVCFCDMSDKLDFAAQEETTLLLLLLLLPERSYTACTRSLCTVIFLLKISAHIPLILQSGAHGCARFVRGLGLSWIVLPR